MGALVALTGASGEVASLIRPALSNIYALRSSDVRAPAPLFENERYVRANLRSLSAMRRAGVATIFLASPTTAPERLRAISEASTGFIYYVSRTGVTGERKSVSLSLSDEMKRLREIVRGPVCIGFGISTEEQVREVAALGDGVVVGSALVKEIEMSNSIDEAERKLEAKVRALKKGI